MKNITYIILLILIAVTNGKGQTPISGTINPSSVINNVGRNFTGFNSGGGYLEMIYNKNGTAAGLETNPYLNTAISALANTIYYRFPGGTTSNFYNRFYAGYGGSGYANLFGDEPTFLPPYINVSTRNTNYGSYVNYTTTSYPNASSNVIFPFINSITSNKTLNANSTFVLNLVCHYRNVNNNGYYIRTETLQDTNKIKAINNLYDFNNSSLSTEFKKLVTENINSFLTLNSNKVNAKNIEFGNELFSYMYNDYFFTDYNSFKLCTPLPADGTVWIKDDGTSGSISDSYRSLWALSHLCRLYRVLINDTVQKLATIDTVYAALNGKLKYGITLSGDQNGGFSRWNNFFLLSNVKSYIGNQAYILHVYCDSTHFFKNVSLSDKSTTNTTTLNNEFNLIRDSFEIAFRKRTLLNEQVKYVNNMPANSEAWVTEWNIMFDWDKIKKVGNTLLHSMFYTDQILSYFDMNANVNLVTSCNKSNPIQICNYHVSYAGNDNDTWYPMMRFPSGYNSTYIDYKTTTNSNPNDIRYQSTFYAQQLLSPIINDTSIKYINNINGGFTVLQNCLFRTFFRENDAGCFGCSNSDLYIYFNNKSSNNYSIAIQTALSNFLGTTYCISSAKKNYLYANNLFCVHG